MSTPTFVLAARTGELPARLERNDHGTERISPEADLPTVEPETRERLFDLLFPPVIVELKVKPLQTGREALTAESKRVQEPEAKDVTTETRRRPPVLVGKYVGMNACFWGSLPARRLAAYHKPSSFPET